MLKRVSVPKEVPNIGIPVKDASFPAPFSSGLEYASPARGTWNIVHTGMLIPEAHEIFVCAASCLRGVVLTAAELGAAHRFSTVEVRENNLLDGDMEDLVIDGVSDVIEKLPVRPPIVLVYTSCVHHFAGCDLDMIYDELSNRFPDIDFVDCYMNPIMRKSGLTPDQLMRSRLYKALKPREIKKGSVAIIGNDLPTDESSDLMQLLRANNLKIHEITSCENYAQYQEMAESEFYISYYPSAAAGGDMLSERLGGTHIYVPFSFDYDEIEAGLTKLSDKLNIPALDFSGKREECEKAVKETLALIGDTPIAIDYTYSPRPLGLAKFLLENGFNVKRVYLDAITGEEKPALEALKACFPELQLYPTVHASMRFLSEKEPTNYLAIGQKAAHFMNTNHFVNVVEGGGMFGYHAVLHTLELMREAFTEEKDMRNLIQIKGMGCGGCI
ncbi:MAG: nitrogenase [Oscillospiraceae bacterium]|nr:nitrogenase [Oscillospiraceae bacterium]